MRTNHPGAQPKPADELKPGMLFSCLQGSYKYENGKPISNKALPNPKGKVSAKGTCSTTQSSSCVRLDLEYNSERIGDESKFFCSTCQLVKQKIEAADKSTLTRMGVHELSYTCTDCGGGLHDMCNTEFEPKNTAQRMAVINF